MTCCDLAFWEERKALHEERRAKYSEKTKRSEYRNDNDLEFYEKMRYFNERKSEICDRIIESLKN